ncbi:MAG: hypothetical protein HGA37_14845, partial [Lentimicrobium sp.]|nr:hypothetical protein [Lentimicrobium sp.]
MLSKNLKQIVLPVILLFSMLQSCNLTDKKPGDSSEANNKAGEVPGKTEILRYEKALFSIPDNNFAGGIKDIADEYSIFLGKNYDSPEALNQLQGFVKDRQNQDVYAECMKRYPDLDWLANEFTKALKILNKEIPEVKTPRVYTYVSGFDFDYPIKYADTAIIIALDMYLGSDYDGYPKMGIPVYISERLTPAHIMPDCLKEMALPLLKRTKASVLLDAMIEEGKILHFCSTLLPGTDDYLKIGYTKEQLEWCIDNENSIWSFLIENELLYSADAQSMS